MSAIFAIKRRPLPIRFWRALRIYRALGFSIAKAMRAAWTIATIRPGR